MNEILYQSVAELASTMQSATAQQPTLMELAEHQDLCNAPVQTKPYKEKPCKSVVTEYEQHCMNSVHTKQECVSRLSNELGAAMDACLHADQDLYDAKAMLATAETEVTNHNHVLVECSANLSRCDAELAQAILERDASQTLVHCIMTRDVARGSRVAPAAAPVAPAPPQPPPPITSHSPYVIARKKRLGIKMLSVRYGRGAPSGDVHKAFMSDLKEFLVETEGRKLTPQQVQGCSVDYYRLIAEVLQAGGIEVVIHTKYGLRNIANRLRIGNKVLRGGRSTVDAQLKAIYLDTLYRYEQLLCLGRNVQPGKVEMLMAAGPSNSDDVIEW